MANFRTVSLSANGFRGSTHSAHVYYLAIRTATLIFHLQILMGLMAFIALRLDGSPAAADKSSSFL